MPENVFTPNLKNKPAVQVVASEPEVVAAQPAQLPETEDKMSSSLLTFSRIVVVLLTLLLPAFFIPGLWGSLGFQKFLALTAVVLVVATLSLLMLRHGRIRSVIPMSAVFFAIFVLVAAVSALFSADPTAGFRGNYLETGTVGFYALLAGVMTIPLVLQQSKKFVMLTLQAVVVSAFVVLLYNVLRIFLGPVLAFQSFGSVTVSPLGAFNDLAVFAGLSVLISLVALLQLPLKKSLQFLLLGVIGLSLIVLAVVNFFFVWVVTGFFGLLMLLYVVSRDSLFATVGSEVAEKQDSLSHMLMIATALVCLVSAWFIVMGDVASSQINRLFDISYLEVRPSFTATADIARAVYADNLLLGTGPNQFTDGWRQHKDTGINETIFWATDFTAGSSYATTIAVTTGVLGLLAMLLFHGYYAWFGFRMLAMSRQQDKFWYFAGVVSFTGAAFLWFMSYLYVPGATILIMAAFLTGLSFVAGATLLPTSVKIIPLVVNRQRGFGLMAVAILLISASVGALFTTSQQYIAHATFNKIQATTTEVAVVDQAALTAYSQYPDHVFLGVRARIALLEMNQLLGVTEPTETEQQQFLNVSGRALAAANQAISDAPRNPEYHVILAAIYNNLAMAGVPDALARSTTSLATAKDIDPKNPTYALVEAQMAVRRGDAETARQALQQALSQKRNFTEALFLLAQIDIAEGNTEAAIASTEAMITLEPTNATRYYQLGILRTSVGDVVGAQQAYGAALQIDPDFANARYLRALLLADAGNVEVAISELELVRENNQENESLTILIDQLASGELVTGTDTDSLDVPVSELAPNAADDTVTSPVVPDSDLLTPLNTVSANSGEETTDQVIEIENPEVTAEEEVSAELEP